MHANYSYRNGSTGLILAACQAGYIVARKLIVIADTETTRKSINFVFTGKWLR
jgi:hypothetical protein